MENRSLQFTQLRYNFFAFFFPYNLVYNVRFVGLYVWDELGYFSWLKKEIIGIEKNTTPIKINYYDMLFIIS